MTRFAIALLLLPLPAGYAAAQSPTPPQSPAMPDTGAPFSHAEAVAMIEQLTDQLVDAARREAQLRANMGLLLARLSTTEAELRAEKARADAAEKRADQQGPTAAPKPGSGQASGGLHP